MVFYDENDTENKIPQLKTIYMIYSMDFLRIKFYRSVFVQENDKIIQQKILN